MIQVEEKYQQLSEIEHVLKRPGMWIGSKNNITAEQFIPVDGEMVLTTLTYNPGFQKLFDEIISNSVDEHRRKTRLNKIEVTVDRDKGTISINDNGGIPVVMHKDAKQYVPEMIFSNLRAGSNFDDTQDRSVAGTNGVGSTLTNIFSKKFELCTSDGKNVFKQTFTNNMKKRSTPNISKSGRYFTRIKYTPDIERFGITTISDDDIGMMRRRASALAATNPKLQIIFNGEKFNYKSFKNYVDMFTEDGFYDSNDKWEIVIAKSENGFQQQSFVNSVETYDGGTHVDHIVWQLVSKLRESIKRRHKYDLKPSDIKSHFFIFINTTVRNPEFSSQTKEKLITEPKALNDFELTDKMIYKIFTSEILVQILEWIEKRKLAEERAELRKLNKLIGKGKVDKLIDAKERKDRDKCTLGLFEGFSALSAVRQYRDAQYMGAFPLKGKFMNVLEVPNTKVIKNAEARDIMVSLGLKMGETPENLKYGKIAIFTDADVDGDAICALLLNFFMKYWPELFEQGRIYRVLTPIVVAKKKAKTEIFYSQDDYQKWFDKTNTKGWEIEYKKGLAALENAEYEDMIKNPVMVQITKDQMANDSFRDWFGPDSAPRKIRILKN